MYKVILADDEGIVLESLKVMIKKNFGELCEVETAKTGRSVIELAEQFRPDIAIMDIQMPGINGIDAMAEIQKFCTTTQFVIISAYDKFDYAKRAIDLGVIEFITKPFNTAKIVNVLEKAMKSVDQERKRRKTTLANLEKLEAVRPLLESSFIYTILFQEECHYEVERYKVLFDLQEKYGWMMVLELGEAFVENKMTNPVGISVRAQRHYGEIREIIKTFFVGMIGPVMANKIAVFMPAQTEVLTYEERIQMMEQAREMLHKLKQKIDCSVRIGIGAVKTLEELPLSYQEALKAMKKLNTKVASIEDFKPHLGNGEEKLDDQRLVVAFRKGNRTMLVAEAGEFYEEVVSHYLGELLPIKEKLLEELFFLGTHIDQERQWPTHAAYLETLLSLEAGKLKEWFMSKVTECAEEYILQDEGCSELIQRAKEYIDTYYNKDLSLEMAAKQISMSPYYFSKIFKEETGENFIDYLTKKRIEKAEKLLKKRELSIKEICIEVGYKDPNYFSRLFKKYRGLTPTEYREEKEG